MKKNKKNKGFTLFELLVSISIIGILTALATVSYSSAQKKARDARRIEDLKLVQTAAEQFYTQNNYVYPSTTLTVGWTSSSGQAFLNAFPVDPKNDASAGYVYAYTPGSLNTTYCACALVENPVNGNSSNAFCTFGTGITGSYFCVKNQQ